jgi:hypothetical protein
MVSDVDGIFENGRMQAEVRRQEYRQMMLLDRNSLR